MAFVPRGGSQVFREPPERVALLSIKPEYAEAIFTGRKTVEFRRSRLAADIKVVLVYATQPVGRILGWFEVADVIESTPIRLWEDYADRGAVDPSAYFAYFTDANQAFGILVRRATRLDRPAELGQLSPGLKAPQKFQYLAPAVAAGVLAA
jgi:predicted transcriptional regulator